MMDIEQLHRLCTVCNWVLIFGTVLSPGPIGIAWNMNNECYPEKHWPSFGGAILYALIMLVAAVFRTYVWVWLGW